jgi:hypothetical protein
MSTQASVFVSHSSADRALTEEVCRLLRVPADESTWGYDVLVDFTEVKPGAIWPRHLHEWMARCHAAVVLLTPDAVASDWVLKEATILTWRMSIDANFRVFIARDRAVVTQQVLDARGFAPLMLGQIQQIAGVDPAIIAMAVRGTFGNSNPGETPFDQLVGRLSDLLGKVGRNTLAAVVRKLHLAAPAWRPDRDQQAQMVESIAGQVLRGDLGQYASLADLIDEFRLEPDSQVVSRILHIVAPYWVDQEAAGKLPPLLAAKVPRRRVAAMNGAAVSRFTAGMYVRRAHPLSGQHEVIQAGAATSGDIVADVTHDICEHMRRDPWLPGIDAHSSDEDIVSALQHDTPLQYVVLSPPLPDARAIADLADRFPSMTFVCSTGSQLQPDQTLDRVYWITPPVDLVRERQEEEGFIRASRIINRMGR